MAEASAICLAEALAICLAEALAVCMVEGLAHCLVEASAVFMDELSDISLVKALATSSEQECGAEHPPQTLIGHIVCAE